MHELTYCRDVPGPRVGSIDVGTNTVMLLITDFDPDGTLRPLYEEERFARLGDGVDRNMTINEAAMARLATALLAHKQTCKETGVDTILVTATSASRDARNQAELQAFVMRETGLRYHIVSGREEARLSFIGALSAAEVAAGPRIVVDVGGGSTEIIRGILEPGAAEMQQFVSLNIGGVRFTERFFSKQPPVPREIDALVAEVQHQLHTIPWEIEGSEYLLGAAGTFTILGMVYHDISDWNHWPATQLTMSRSQLAELSGRLGELSGRDILDLNPHILSGRSDVVYAGALIVETLMDAFGFKEYRTSIRGLRHGAAINWWRNQFSNSVKA